MPIVQLQGLEHRRELVAGDVAQARRSRNPTSRARRTDGSRDGRAASATAPPRGPSSGSPARAACPWAAECRAARWADSGSSRRGPRGPCPRRRPRPTRPSAGALRWPGPGCPSAWPPSPPWPPCPARGPRRPSASAASGSARACPASGPSSRRRRAGGPAWRSPPRRCPSGFPASCGSRRAASPWDTASRCVPGHSGRRRTGPRCSRRPRCERRREPMPPTPMPAMFSFSLGGVWPGPPSTWRGTMVMAAAACAGGERLAAIELVGGFHRRGS